MDSQCSFALTCTMSTEHKIQNEHLWNYFLVPDPLNIIHKCQFNLLDKFACMDPSRLPSKNSLLLGLVILDILVDSTTQYGTPTLKCSSIILLDVSNNGSFDSWLPIMQNCEHWKQLGTEQWMKCQQTLTIYHYGYHPILGDGILDHKFLWYLQDIHCRISMTGRHS